MTNEITLNDYFQIFLGFIFSLIIISSIGVLYITRDIYAQVYLIPLWSAPLAYAAIISSIFFLALMYKFRDWKHEIAIFLFYDTSFELANSLYLRLTGKDTQHFLGDGIFIQTFIIGAFLLSIFFLLKLQIIWNRKYFLIAIIIGMIVNSYFGLEQIFVLVPLTLIIYFTFQKRSSHFKKFGR